MVPPPSEIVLTFVKASSNSTCHQLPTLPRKLKHFDRGTTYSTPSSMPRKNEIFSNTDTPKKVAIIVCTSHCTTLVVKALGLFGRICIGVPKIYHLSPILPLSIHPALFPKSYSQQELSPLLLLTLTFFWLYIIVLLQDSTRSS